MKNTPSARALPFSATLLALSLVACGPGGEGTGDGQAQAGSAESSGENLQANASSSQTPNNGSGTVYDSRTPATTPAPPASATQQGPNPDPHAGHDHGPLGQENYSYEGPPGKLEVTNGEHDFGSMIEGEVAEHTFDLKSTGDNPLVIHNAKPTCGCTVSQVQIAKDGDFVDYTYNDPIAPGTEIKLKAKLNTKNKSHKTQSKINIYCNDPASVVTLGLTAQVGTYFTVTPPNLSFGELSTQDSIEKTATVRSTLGDSFKLLPDAETTLPGVTSELVPINPDENGLAKAWEIRVKVGPGPARATSATRCACARTAS